MPIEQIANDFAAYIMLCDKQFLVTINDRLCKFFARENRDDMRVFCDKPIKKQFVFGFDENNNKVALMIEQSVPNPVFVLNFGPNYQSFTTPVIIKGRRSKDRLDELENFDAITFTGGVIDSIYPPGIQALDVESLWKRHESGSRAIKIRAFDEYTYRYPFELFCEKGAFLYSVSQDGSDGVSGKLGKLSAMIRLEFDSPQPLDGFEHYYVLIKNFISFCVGQHNIRFDGVELNRRITEGKDAGKFQELGICKVFDDYVDYIESAYNRVLLIKLFDASIINALKLFSDAKSAPILDFLPGSNKRTHMITYDDIRNICTALEFEYAKGKFPSRKKEEMRGLKKEIKNTISKYCEENRVPKEIKDRALSSFRYLDISAADMFCAMRDRIKKRLAICCTDESIMKAIDIEDRDIRELVKARNNITHGRLITEWGNIVESYIKLYRVAYLCILDRIGISEENFIQCIERINRII